MITLSTTVVLYLYINCILADKYSLSTIFYALPGSVLIVILVFIGTNSIDIFIKKNVVSVLLLAKLNYSSSTQQHTY